MNPLVQRILTAVCLATLLVVLLFAAPAPVSVAVLALLMLLAAWEWSAFLSLRRTGERLGYVAVAGVVLGGLYLLVPARLGFLPVLLLSLGWWMVAFLWILRYPTPVPRVFAGFAGMVVLGPTWLVLADLLQSGSHHGPVRVMLVLAIVWAADIGAYFVGRRAGRVKLAPHISPGKTWEGLLGGVAAAVVAAAIGGAVVGLPLGFAIPMGLGVAAISVVGDLTESMFKRNVGLKDSGRLFPGHGGVLDRIDSITAAVPLFALMLYWFDGLG